MTEELSHAPDFPHHFYWFNTQQPLSLLDDLAGYVVLVHFFSSTSVNCHHVLPTLHALEQQFIDRSFLVVCVYSGKHESEGDQDHAQEVIRRYGIRHPVIVDEEAELFESYGCRAWPTIALIDAGGCLRFQGAGEPSQERMAGAISFLLDDAAANGDEPYMEIDLDEYEPEGELAGLQFPSGVAVDERAGRLWIADTARHRVVAATWPGEAGQHRVLKVFGTGRPGAADGAGDVASFCEPTSLALVDDALLVADAGNHLVRRVSFDADRVETMLGTGMPGADRVAGASGRDQALNSPWGLAVSGDDLYVAAAGANQILRVDHATMTAAIAAGTGAFGAADGVHDATLAQPAGLAVRDGQLALADSASDSLRCLDLDSGEVRTLASGAPMQFPTSVAWHGDDVLVADTLGDKVRRYRAATGTLETLAVDVHRPAELRVVGDTLLIADAGNHRILQLGLMDCVVTELTFAGLPLAQTAFGSKYVRAESVAIRAMAEVTLRLPMELGEGTRLLPGTAASLEVTNSEGYPLLSDMTVTPDIEDGWFMARGVAAGAEGEGVVQLRLVYATCEASGSVTHAQERRIHLPVQVTGTGDGVVDVRVSG